MEPIQEFRKLQERLVESEMRILLIIYYKKKLKLQEDKKTNVNAKMFTLTTEFSCTLISCKSFIN